MIVRRFLIVVNIDEMVVLMKEEVGFYLLFDLQVKLTSGEV